MIRISPPDYSKDGRPNLSVGTTFHSEDGSEITGIVSADVHFRVDEFVSAVITITAECDEVWAQPFMSEASFLDAAKRYGYEVKKKDADHDRDS